MNLLLSIVSFVVIVMIVAAFWVVMVEAQEQAQKEDENRRSWKSDADLFDAMEAWEEEAEERLNDWRYEQDEVR